MFTYKPELDGLRAVAVLSVVLFHAGFELFSGGFVGVDIFFVLSGYLITSITIQEIERDTFTFASFYERRVRRLLPPLIPVLAITWLASAALLGQREFFDTAKSFAATLALVANWYFYSSVGYFDGPGELTPLLHMWSLSIEEQFYLIFPFILFTLFRNQIRPVWVCAVFLALSFGYSVYLLKFSSNELLFYSSLGRFWELLVGSCLAFLKPNGFKARGISDVSEAVGVGLIGWSIFNYDSSMSFPGPAALLPTIGTALIIIGGGRGHIVSPILKFKPVIWLGLISYGLYLWHWPIFVFVRHVDPLSSRLTMVLASLLAITLSIASYHLLEKPIRQKRWLAGRKEIYSFGAVTFSAIAAVVILSFLPKLDSAREQLSATIRESLYDDDSAKVLARLEVEKKRYHAELNLNFHGGSPAFDLQKHHGYTCSFDGGNSQLRVLECLIEQASKRNVLIIGDSIGRDTYHALRRAYPSINFIMLHQSSCPPAETPHRSKNIICFPGFADTLSKLSNKVDISGVVLNFRYRPKDWWAVNESIPFVKSLTDNVVMLGVTPMFALTIDRYIKGLPAGTHVPSVILKNNKQMILWDFDDQAQQAEKVARKQDVAFANISPFFCNDKSCRLWIENSYERPLIWDNQHLTDDGISQYGRYLSTVPAIEAVLRRSQG